MPLSLLFPITVTYRARAALGLLAAGPAGVYQQLAAKCVAGASVRDLCIEGDALIIEATSKAYNKKVDGKAVEKGVGFPTCLSVNHVICHHSPLASDPDVVLAEGDMVKM